MKKSKIEPLSNFDIMEMMKPYKNFIGVFSRDNTEYLKKNQSLILNLGDHNSEGTHWVALYKNKDGSKVFYFDSYGFPPVQEIVDIYKKHKNKIVYSSNKIQKDNSIMCGYYAMMFIREMYKDKNMYDFIYNFDITSTDNNENLVKKYFNLV